MHLYALCGTQVTLYAEVPPQTTRTRVLVELLREAANYYYDLAHLVS